MLRVRVPSVTHMINERDHHTDDDIREQKGDINETILQSLDWLNEQIGYLKRNIARNPRGESFIQEDLKKLSMIREKADNGDYDPLIKELKEVAELFMIGVNGKPDKGSRLYDLGCEYLGWAERIESEKSSKTMKKED